VGGGTVGVVRHPPYDVRPSVRSATYVTPSRRATRTALSNSSSARAYHLDVATLRRFSPAAAAAAAAAVTFLRQSVSTSCLASASRPVCLEPPVQRAVTQPSCRLSAPAPPLPHGSASRRRPPTPPECLSFAPCACPRRLPPSPPSRAVLRLPSSSAAACAPTTASAGVSDAQPFPLSPPRPLPRVLSHSPFNTRARSVSRRRSYVARRGPRHAGSSG
jgi:hypothetical protein